MEGERRGSGGKRRGNGEEGRERMARRGYSG